MDKTLNLNGEAIAMPNYKNGERVIEIIDDLYENKGLYSVGVIDLDENDNYKEMVIQMHNGIFQDYYIYRVEKDGLVEIFQGNEEYDFEDNTYGLIKVKDKWIACIVFVPYSNWNFIDGYYMYEDGEFKYVDRLLTGEKLTDENGNFPERLQNIVFDNTGKYETLYFVQNNNYDEKICGKINLISRKKSDPSYKYTIRVVEDIEKDGVIIPAGTILEDVSLSTSY